MLNSKIQGRTDKEYREDIRDELLMKKKEHYEQNREHENYEANKEHLDAKRKGRYERTKMKSYVKEKKHIRNKKHEKPKEEEKQ